MPVRTRTWESVATLEFDMVEDIWKCNSISMQCSSIGLIPLATVLSTPAAYYSTGDGGNHCVHKVEHGAYSANDCASTAIYQAAREFISDGVLNHCMLSRAHNLLNGKPSDELVRIDWHLPSVETWGVLNGQWLWL